MWTPTRVRMHQSRNLFVKSVMPRLLLAAVCLLTLLGPGEGLVCYVCLPDVAGALASRDAAVLWIANISRTWPGVTQSDLGACSDFAKTDTFQKSCNYGIEFTACITAYNSDWTARTCGRLPNGVQDGDCQTNKDVTVCYNTQDFSNLQVGNGAPSPGVQSLLVLVSALVPALVSALVSAFTPAC
ncbi:uncharacterized protein [Procambarus clarkii]|uniref:uncharacterized protein isoform X1 n=2 Tax=Procambarus clarkii TaxID=6728 RepID=UPI00374207AE